MEAPGSEHPPNTSPHSIDRRLRWLTWAVTGLTVVVVVLAISHWLGDDGRVAERTPVPLFQRAIEDAATATEEDVSHQLRPVRRDDPRLIWREEPDDQKRWLKVVSWMSDTAFQQHFAPLVDDPEGAKTPTREPVIWVTLAPEIQQFCRALNLPDPSFRLKQYLGLDPNRRYQHFVELWVQPEDLFRPCPDPETDDTNCELHASTTAPPKVKNIPDYAAYFTRLKARQYQRDGAPWTRLGYTYDWAYGTRGVGASEYVIVPDARYIVAGNATTDEYCLQ